MTVEQRTEAKMQAFMSDMMEVMRKHKASFEVRETSNGYYSYDITVEVDFESNYETGEIYQTAYMSKYFDYKD